VITVHSGATCNTTGTPLLPNVTPKLHTQPSRDIREFGGYLEDARGDSFTFFKPLDVRAPFGQLMRADWPAAYVQAQNDLKSGGAAAVNAAKTAARTLYMAR
jgi:hypothetical protein